MKPEKIHVYYRHISDFVASKFIIFRKELYELIYILKCFSYRISQMYNAKIPYRRLQYSLQMLVHYELELFWFNQTKQILHCL